MRTAAIICLLLSGCCHHKHATKPVYFYAAGNDGNLSFLGKYTATNDWRELLGNMELGRDFRFVFRCKSPVKNWSVLWPEPNIR